MMSIYSNGCWQQNLFLKIIFMAHPNFESKFSGWWLLVCQSELHTSQVRGAGLTGPPPMLKATIKGRMTARRKPLAASQRGGGA